MTGVLRSYSDPLVLFTAVVDRLNAGDWPGVAQLCDSTSLAAFKRTLLDEVAGPGADTHKLTATELMKAVPNMPRAVAEYQVARFRESLDPRQRMRELVPGIASRSALDAMKPADVFAAWLDGRSMRRQLERAVELRHITRAMAGEALTQGTAFALESLGWVMDGGQIAHIIYRRTVAMRGPFPSTDELTEAGVTPAEMELMREAWGRERPRSVMARRQPKDAWLLVADTDFLLVEQDALAATPGT